MSAVSFLRPDGSASFGRLAGETVYDLARSGGPLSLKAALAAGALAHLADGPAFALSDVTLLPVLPDPGRILCIGLNYANHVQEMGRTQMGHPAVFTRWAHTLVAHGQPILRPRESERLDYEGELAVVIGTAGRRIAPERAMDHVAGFSIFQDASVRDWQRHNSQFTPGKNFPATGGFGPALVTPDEVPDWRALRVETRLNDAVVQDQPIADMIWDVPAIIAYVSTFLPLEPGDVIATGTPGGVGDGRTPPLYMKGGDRVEVTIGALGTLANAVVDEG